MAWRADADVDALAGPVERPGAVMEGNPRIREIDLNPVMLHPVGQGAVALDTLMLVDPAWRSRT